jgi:hypothetical protein
MTGCERTLALLDDLVDGSPLDASVAEAARAHLRTCAACSAEERSLRDLVARAATLPHAIEPERDLWPAIRDRLEGEPARASGPPARAWSPAVAASLLVAAVTGGLGWALLRAPEPIRTARGAEPTAHGRPVPASHAAADSDLDAADATLVQAKHQLVAALEARRGSMSPETAATVDRNLAVVEKAVDEIRQALARDPGNGELHRMLLAAQRRELDLLERVAAHSRGL